MIQYLVLPFALLLFLCGTSCGRPPDLPNFVLIIGDDQGYTDFGFTGSRWVQTPNLDSLAAEGVLFTTAHTTSSECAGSLNSLLTGLYPYQWSLRACQMRNESRPTEEPCDVASWNRGYDEVDGHFPIDSYETLPRLLAARGYASFQSGKYWEGTYDTAGFSDGTKREFDPARPHGTDSLRSLKAVYAFIDEHRSDPFFVWFAPMLPHIPHSPPPRTRKLYHDTPVARSTALYYGMCTWFDEFVGGLVEHLEAAGVRNNTMLIYIADNGWVQLPSRWNRGPQTRFFGGPAGKASLHDMGFRTPIILNWPDGVEGGAVIDELVSAVDIVPTVLDYAGIAPPEHMPGRSLRTLIEGTAEAPREFIIGSLDLQRPHSPEQKQRVARWHPGRSIPFLIRERGFYLRTEKWHFIWYEEHGTEELYDVSQDPYGERDLADDHKELVERFQVEIRRWKSEAARSLAGMGRLGN